MASLIRSLSLFAMAGLSLAVFTFAGCNNDPPKPAVEAHPEHPMPETFDAAVAELKEHAPEIKEAFEAGKSEDVHGELHFLGELSEKMTALIDASDLSDEQKTQAKEASEVLFDQYTELDGTFHGSNSELKYSDIESKIDESLAKLVELRNAKDEPASEASVTDEKPAEETSTEENP